MDAVEAKKLYEQGARVWFKPTTLPYWQVVIKSHNWEDTTLRYEESQFGLGSNQWEDAARYMCRARNRDPETLVYLPPQSLEKGPLWKMYELQLKKHALMNEAIEHGRNL